jgi:hypothetical protein
MGCPPTLSKIGSLQGSVKRRWGVEFLIDLRGDRAGNSFPRFEARATTEACDKSK